MEKSKALVVGGTGFIGRRLVAASLAQGHPTFVLMRPEIGVDVDKLQTLLSFKAKGARLVEASLDDHAGLVAAVRQVDVVLSAMSGTHLPSQHKLVEAIKEAGNVKRFLPSEFGTDPSRMEHALEPGRITFDEKMEVRRAIEAASIPHTYISANCFAAYFGPNLAQIGTLLPPKEKVRVYGDGNVKAIFVDEDDVATYTMKTIDDPRALNKTIYLRPPENILSQWDLIVKWEKLSGNVLEKIYIPVDEFLASMKDTTVLSDGTYELIPESEEGDQEAQLNATVLTEDPNQNLEEPKANLSSDYREGMSFEDQIASLSWPCSLPPGWSVEWDPSSASNDPDE